MNLKLKKKVKSRNNNGIVQKIRENCGGVFSPILKDILFNFSLNCDKKLFSENE